MSVAAVAGIPIYLDPAAPGQRGRPRLRSHGSADDGKDRRQRRSAEIRLNNMAIPPFALRRFVVGASVRLSRTHPDRAPQQALPDILLANRKGNYVFTNVPMSLDHCQHGQQRILEYRTRAPRLS